MRYRVSLLRRAEDDVKSISLWIAQRSLQGAENWLVALQTLMGELENDSVEIEIREALLKTPRGRPYRAIFTLVGEDVRVLRIRGPGQRPLKSDDVS